MLRASPLAVLLTLVACLPAPLLANPSGGQFRQGAGSIHGQGTSSVEVHQSTRSGIVTWDSFDIEAGESTRFIQPGQDAVTLNRILQGDASQIMGSLSANGRLYLVNPNGILFGPGSRVDVHALVATTSLDGRDFGGGFDPSAEAAPGATIVNKGRIQSGDGGFVYLVAPHVKNGRDGVIVSPGGEVRIEAGATVYLSDAVDGSGLVLEYTAPAGAGTKAVNLGEVLADGGLARLRADVVRQKGFVEANAIREVNGTIELFADSTLRIGAGSRTLARGGEAPGSDAGTILALSEGDAVMEAGALMDVSARAVGADGGFAELSGVDTVEVAGRFKARAGEGGVAGDIVIDPAELLVTGGTSFAGAGRVLLTADEKITVLAESQIRLSSPSAGDGTAAPQTLTLRSGGDIEFGPGARIQDDGSGADGEKVWDVELVAGADLARDVLGPNPTDEDVLALDPASSGGLHLLGPSFEGGAGVELTDGDLLVRAAGDVVLEDGTILASVRGDVDVESGGDVLFLAGRSEDTLIESGSGDVRVVAEGSVLLQGAPSSGGNAGIRTRGVPAEDADGLVSLLRGGDILVWARTGDVDAGIANRWILPGPPLQSNAPERIPLGLPLRPDFDPVPVNTSRLGNLGDGALGIVAEAGGSVTVIAAGDVVSRNSALQRAAGSAHGQAVSYDGAHIGVLGVPVRYETDPEFGLSGAVVLDPRSDDNRVIVVAGGNVTGDYMVRQGDMTVMGGYSLPAEVSSVADLLGLGFDDPASLGLDALRNRLRVSDSTGDRGLGWVGTTNKPITFDLVQGSVEAVGWNGVAVRAVENPSLVYPPGISGENKKPTYGENDFALLESEAGDVALLGNDSALPNPRESGRRSEVQLVRLLPPSLVVRTGEEGSRPGDFVLLNDFVLYPSRDGGLELDVAGQVRTATPVASSAAVIGISAETTGDAADLSFSLPAGARLQDPVTGLVYTLDRSIDMAPRSQALPSSVNVRFMAERGFENQEVLIPAGTRIEDRDGRVYATRGDQLIPAPELRLSEGVVRIVPEGREVTTPISIPAQTRFVTPEGAVFETIQGVNLQRGDRAVELTVRALPGNPGVDAAAGALQLETPIPGIESATNRFGTQRLPEVTVAFFAEVPGAADRSVFGEVKNLLDPVPGARFGYAEAPPTRGGADPGTVGQLTSDPAATAPVSGPVGEIRDPRELVLLDTQLLPKGVSPDEIVIIAQGVEVGAQLTPAILKAGGPDGRPDEPGDLVSVIEPADAWLRTSAGAVARIKQSDAAPDFDARNFSNRFDYYTYFSLCRSGVQCPANVPDPLDLSPERAPLQLGSGPTHAADGTPALLHAGRGFDRIEIDLAEAAILRAGPRPGEPFSGVPANVRDAALITQHTKASDVTRIEVPYGDVLLGAAPRMLLDAQTGLPTEVLASPLAGFTVSGPGSLVVQVGVTGDAVVTGVGGQLGLSDVAVGNSSARGIETIGNLSNAALPEGGATITVTTAGNVELNDRGAIDTVQGGDIRVTSVAGSILGGEPDENFRGKRGITTLYVPSGSSEAAAGGGGSIFIDAFGDFDIGSSAAATLSGGNVTLRSRTGSISAGSAEPFEILEITSSPTTSLPEVQYLGGGIFASTGNVSIVAEEDVDIGAGITGASISIAAGGDVVAGAGAISASGNINIDAGGSISGTISASGSISVTGGEVSQSADISAGGLVVGAGSVGSNTAGNKVGSSNVVNRGTAELAAAQTQLAGGQNRRGVMIEVTSREIDAIPGDLEEDE